MTPAVGLVIGLALLEYIAIVALTGRARVASGIAAPATTGDPHFERMFRVQQNTIEQLIVFIPALLLFSQFVNGGWLALLLGLGFVASRAVYARAYVRDPASRGPGFVSGALLNLALVLGGIAGAFVGLFGD